MMENKRFLLSIVWTILGIVLLTLSLMNILDSSVYAGFGGGLTAVGALQIARFMKYSKDPSYKEKVDIEMQDERNRFLRMKSWSWTGYILVLACGLGAVISFITGEELLQIIFSCAVCSITLIYWIVFLLVRRKY